MQNGGARGAGRRWALLLAIVGLYFAASFGGAGAPAEGGRERGPDERAGARFGTGLGIRVQTKLELAHAGRDVKGDAAAMNETDFQKAFDRHVDNAAERLLLVPVAGELLGAGAARLRLRMLTGLADQQILELLGRIYGSGEDRELTPEDASFLREEMGWFGELALVYGMADDDADRAALLQQARRTVMLGGLFVVVFVLGLVGMLIGFLLFCRALYRRRIPRRDVPPPPQEGDEFWLEVPILFLGGLLLIGALGAPPWAIWVLPVTLLWPLRRGFTWHRLAAGYGLTGISGLWGGRGLIREMVAGVAGYLSLFPFVILAGIVSVVLVRSTGVNPTHPAIESGIQEGSFPSLVLLTCLWAPLFEEAVFRGALWAYLSPRVRGLAAAATTGILFAMVHPQGFTVLPILAAMGTVLALLRLWRGTLIASITAHSLHNGVLMAVLYVVM